MAINGFAVHDHLTRLKVVIIWGWSLRTWCEKWENQEHLSKEWTSFIVNDDAHPAKNKPLYKTHKNGTPVRLLTSGNGSATENLSLYVEKICGPLANNLRSNIKDTGHMLEIID